MSKVSRFFHSILEYNYFTNYRWELNLVKNKHLILILSSIFIATFITSVETTIVTTALPTITSDLHGISMQNWVFSMYLLTTAISTPIYGKFSDQIGRKPVFLIGLFLFVLGSSMCGFAPNIVFLIFSRAIQGMGAGAVMPVTFTIIADVFPVDKRAGIMALNNTAWGISALFGPLLGGFIVDQLNWHWVFFINAPLGILVFILILFGYKEKKSVSTSLPIDYIGSAVLSVFLITLLLALQFLGNKDSSKMSAIILLIVSFASFIIFLKQENQSINPVIPLKLFRNRTFSNQIFTALLLSGVQIGFQIYFPQWLQSIYGVSASVAGFAITPSPIFWLIFSFGVGPLIKRFSPKHIALPIIVIQTIFYIPLIFATKSLPMILFYIISAVTGAGLGTIITMNTVIAQVEVSGENVGVASSMLTLGRTLGQTLMTGIFGLIFNTSLNYGIQKNTDISISKINQYIDASTHKLVSTTQSSTIDKVLLVAFHNVFICAIILFVIVFLLNLTDKTNKTIKD